MKVFISNVDGPVGHNLSRLFSNSPVGNRKLGGNEKNEEQAPEEDEVEGEEGVESNKPEKVKDTYSIIGTLSTLDEFERNQAQKAIPGPMLYTGDKKKDQIRKESIEKLAVLGKKPNWVESVVENNRDKLKEALLSADIVVYDLMRNVDEAVWAAEMLSEACENPAIKPKTFICVSTVMTWARTKVESEDQDAFLTEDEYRRRKPHPNFKSHVNAEKAIMKAGKKTSFKTYVVASGLQYHSGDCIFHYLFKAAWHNAPELICYGDGTNVLPTIHVDDLVSILFELAETVPENRYLVALDDSKLTLGDITKAVSEALTTGKVVKQPKENALLNRNIPQFEFDMLTVNLRLEPIYIKEMQFEWKYESGIIDNLNNFIQEFKDARGLQPLKIFVHGAPASGKSMLAKKLAEFYEVHYLNAEEVVNGVLARLEKHAHHVPGSGNATEAAQGAGDESTEDQGDNNAENEEQLEAMNNEAEKIEADKELWEEIQEAIQAGKENGTLFSSPIVNLPNIPEEYIINFIKDRIKSGPCKNQGYILDGFPITPEQASLIFKASGEDEDKGNLLGPIDEWMAPEFVIHLQVSDETIKERILNLPESMVAGTKFQEEVLVKRLEAYRAQNTDEKTVLNYFDEHEIHPIHIQIDHRVELKMDEPVQVESTFKGIAEAIEKGFEDSKEKVGKPRNYGPTAEQIAERKRIREEQLAREAAIAEEERVRKEKEETEKHNKAVAEWNARLEEVRKQEQEVLEAQSVPLRNYLMKHVMPTLTTGLIEVCKVRPEDPIDYLAEYLFKKNPSNLSTPSAALV